jgi:RimJ/RimL family protein N-acetyltransferase
MLEVFIRGEVVDLAIPTEEFAGGNIWYKWLNNRDINKYLEAGIYPNTKKLQVEYFNGLGPDRLVQVIQNKSGIPLGIVSLSFINQVKKTCEFAIFLDQFADPKISGIAALEAVSMIVSHGFELLGMRRITAGQHVNLGSWQQRLELLGFKLEGLHENKFVKGNEVADSISIACLYSDYKKLTRLRSGSLWDGEVIMLNRIKQLPKVSFRNEMDEFFINVRANYYSKLWNL